MGILISWAVLAFSFFLVAKLLDGLKVKGGVLSHFAVAGGFGVLGVILGLVLKTVLAGMTFGISLLPVVNFIPHLLSMALTLLVLPLFTERVSVKGVGAALKAALVLEIVYFVSGLVVQAALAS